MVQFISMSPSAAAAEAALSPLSRMERIDNAKVSLHNRNEDKLRDPVEWLNSESSRTPIPATHHQWPLVVGIYEAYQIA
jgi:hypothetical protein